jgi:hypothetical protein
VVIAEADRRSLEFAAAHRLVEARQVATLLGEKAVDAGERLEGLWRAGLVAGERDGAETPGYFRITGGGLRAIGSRLPVPGFDPRYEHAVGAGWLWLIANAGRFGAFDRVLSERQMRAEDQEQPAPEAPFDVRPGEFGGRSTVCTIPT